MPKRSAFSKSLIAISAVGALGLGAWGLCGGDAAGIEAANGVPNQVWIDRVPQNDRDMITHLLLLDHPKARNFGMVGNSSQWRHHLEVLRWQINGDRLGLLFPQDRRKAKLKARTWECEGEAPEPFELCLELTVGDRSLSMYSRHEWVVEPQGEGLEALIAETPALAGLRGVDVGALDAPVDDDDEDKAEADYSVDADWLP